MNVDSSRALQNIRSFLKARLPVSVVNVIRRIRKRIRIYQGDIFTNPGPITDDDFNLIKQGIDSCKPSVFIEIGTGSGVSCSQIFPYLQENHPACHFYTLDIFKDRCEAMQQVFGNYETFHALHGLSVLREDTTPPAYDELENYKGPVNVLRGLVNTELPGGKVDMAFIDSRKGSALAEFRVLEECLDDKGIIFCHDILNRGKGVEVLDYLEQKRDRFEFEVIDTGPAGMIRCRFKVQDISG